MNLYGWYGLFSTVAGGYLLILTIVNVIYFIRHSHFSPRTDGPLVSVCIPARNEEIRIRPGLAAILEQEYENYEVIVLDDNSTDGTWDILQEAAKGSDRLRPVKGKPLPEGWHGRPYALQQLMAEARGEIVLFIDADMTASPTLVGWAVAHIEGYGVDYFSGYPRHVAESNLEYALFPVIYLVTMALLPVALIPRIPWSVVSHALGQIICFKKSSLEKIGGYEEVKGSINEDVQIARTMKRHGFRGAFLDIKGQLQGNMYDDLPHTLQSLERVLFEYFDRKAYPIVVLSVFIFLVMVAPPFLLIAGLAAGWAGAWLCAVGTVLFQTAWGLTAWNRGLPRWVPFVFPFTFGVLIVLGWRAIIFNLKGQFYTWKGREIR